ncbi:MAG: NADH-quinone oxidoreductase subunit A [Elusimicrobiales bacterium]|nr:NADH-quinone oxidoreductase subunit A [Elusimicrobiales bacterium]HOL63578.1 NADH-quinone oxidoreductase subunit A [Elusimicrobiales bacterium]HPO95053.1 NADH-quinone oxidoreductase subunit A [Elusimicrobiales bacterium]
MKVFIFILALLVSVSVAAGMILFSYLFGPKKKNGLKEENFECGMPQADKPKKAVKTNFYVVAVLFLIFDIEIIFLYPWSVYLKEISFFGFLSGVVFIFMLIITLFYAIKRGALKWD